MRRTKIGFSALALIMSLGLVTAPGVFAKAHNQGIGNGSPASQDGVPGSNVGSETVGMAHDNLGNGPPANANLGASESDSIGRGDKSGDSAGTSGNSGNSGDRGR